MNKTVSTLAATGLLVAALSACSVPTAGVAAPAAAGAQGTPTVTNTTTSPARDTQGFAVSHAAPAAIPADAGEDPYDRVLYDAEALQPLLDEFWTDSKQRSTSTKKLTLPPFSPKRVLSSVRWVSDYAEKVTKRWPHRRVLEHSSWNIHRSLTGFASDACLLWYSSDSAETARASLMIYTAKRGRACEPFYLSLRFGEQDGWIVSFAKGISLQQVDRLSSRE